MVLKVLRKIRETAIKFQCSHQGCEIRLVMEQKKSQHKSVWLAGVLILEFKLWTEEAVVNLQLVTVWSCGRRAKSGTAPGAPEVSQHERVTRVGGVGGRGLRSGYDPGNQQWSTPEECYHQPSVVVSSSSQYNNRLGSSAFYHSRLEIFEVRRVFRK